MIEAKNIRKKFDDVAALDGVSINVKKGSIYGLVGSNGAGKTTLLKILAGIYRQDQGEVLIDNQPVFENIEVKSKTVFIPDSLYFFSQYTVEDMAWFYQQVYDNWDKERYQQLKNVFQLDEKKKIQRMSKGMQRQAAFWLALAIKPDYLILDEPLDGLDPVMRRKVRNLIIQDTADREMTVLISSHNLRELEDLCDCIGVLHQGRLIVEKELDDLKSDIHKVQAAFPHDVPIDIFKDHDVLHREKRGSVQLFIIRGKKNEIIKHISRYQPLILDILPLTLEEIFIYEMGEIGYEIKNVIFK
ncbi:ABC transporter ATP-binding protein [Desulfallas thermosapovorans]|uniref:ABC-2 type transport system ATP-binding protein n=1 Tax=Desulfallas thermosapovorans DSM 6562 TaxID=1121431 RepID=A0A5S4ZRH0_9FIRM|nr:ABC transporter ATP-binding protein [Desulfallas thermosapovorans]TYO95329.1 ABC-2 type transport system ATP-binding protein [Desulfallas thermosapovorans DSM 6562]